jgi:hypothetical protein
MVTSSLLTGRALEKARFFSVNQIWFVPQKNPLTTRIFHRSVPLHEVGQSDREQKTISEKGRSSGPFPFLIPGTGRSLPEHAFLT